jgi:hypothetical protein
MDAGRLGGDDHSKVAYTTYFDPTLRSELTGVRLSTTCGSGTLVKVDVHFKHLKDSSVNMR